MILVRQSLVCVLGIVILATPAHADLIAYEWFDYSAGGDLLQKDGGLGFSGEWIQYDVAPILDGWKVVEGSLTFPRLLSFGNSVTTEAHFDDNWAGLLREFDGVTDDTTTKYMSLLIRPEGVVDEGAFGGAFGIVLAGGGGDGDIVAGKTQGSSDYMLETFFNIDTQFSSIPVQSGETSLLVVKAEFTAGVDTFTMFLNPTPGEPEPLTGTIKNDVDVGDVVGIAIGAAGAVTVDEIRWGDTFADVTPSSLFGDFNGDGQLTVVDIDLLGKEIIAGTNNTEFDLTGDGTVDLADQDRWREDAAIENGFAESYLNGDANLDGSVLVGDLNAVGTNWQTSPDPWSSGDFNANGIVDVADLNLLALNWQGSIPSAASLESVPEPGAFTVLLLVLMATPLLRHRRRPARRWRHA